MTWSRACGSQARSGSTCPISSCPPSRSLHPVGWYEIAERDHELQNPTSAEKIRLLGEYLRLGRESRILDIACGKAGPALVLATAGPSFPPGISRIRLSRPSRRYSPSSR